MRNALIGCAIAGLVAPSAMYRAADVIAAPADPYLLKIAKNGTVLRSPMLKAFFWGQEWNDPTFSRDMISGWIRYWRDSPARRMR